ncbi:MAG: MFS transporter [Chloroflexota bacterium]
MHTQQSDEPRTSRVVNATPFYYGWVILAVGTIGIILTSPGQTYTISVFIDSFIADLGISRSLVSTLYTVGTLTASFAMPFIGRQIDQRGSRQMTIIIVLVFGVACFYMSFVRNALMLGLGFMALRMLGQGSLSLVSSNVINQWWVRRRGMAMGIAGMVSAMLGSGSFPSLLNWLIPLLGWRSTYTLLGAILWGVMLPIGFIFTRNRPEDYGLQPDGGTTSTEPAAPNAKSSDSDEPLLEENWTRAEALRTTVFWLISGGMLVMGALNTGLTFHIFDIFRDSGLSSTVTAFVFIPMSATAAVVQLSGGLLMDRIPVRILLAIALCLQAVILVMAPFLGSIELAYVYGILAGTRGGLFMIVRSVIWAKYFGRQHLGSITGVVSTLNVAGSALGPMPFGIARDLMGNYQTVLIGFAVLPLIFAVATLLYVHPPKRSDIVGR